MNLSNLILSDSHLSNHSSYTNETNEKRHRYKHNNHAAIFLLPPQLSANMSHALAHKLSCEHSPRPALTGNGQVRNDRHKHLASLIEISIERCECHAYTLDQFQGKGKHEIIKCSSNLQRLLLFALLLSLYLFI